MKPRYDLPRAVVGQGDGAALRLHVLQQRFDELEQVVDLSLRRLSWFILPSRVRMCRALSSSIDWPGRMSWFFRHEAVRAGSGRAGAV